MKKIIILKGDGIGPEVCDAAEKVILAIAQKYNLDIEIDYGLIGGIAYDQKGDPFPDSELDKCKQSDAILLGAVGGPKWEALDYSVRPERGLLKLRSELELFANLRPAKVFQSLASSSSLKQAIIDDVDIMVVRELTGGIYFGQPKGVITNDAGLREGFNTMRYDESEIKRIGKVAFDIARLRGKKVCSVDKANVLEVTELWRTVMIEEQQKYPDVELSHMYVDNAIMQLIRYPKQFDTIVTTNMFGDIVSDAAAMLTGSIGMLPSASIGNKTGVYEPVHGSAPDIAGEDKANPLATILSVGMMFKYSFGLEEVNDLIETTTQNVLKNFRTLDIQAEDCKTIGCIEMGEQFLNQMK